MFDIEYVHARQVLDSRGNPTLECEVMLTGGASGRAAVPSGASTGEREAAELRDGDKKRWGGKGVAKAVANVNDKIAGEIFSVDARDQVAIDRAMIALDGTRNKSKLGANATLAVSLAVAQAAANATSQPLYRYVGGVAARRLPAPMLNILNGGKHAGNTVDFQEFMVQPTGFSNFADALRAGVEVYHTLREILHSKHLSTAVGDEGGFAPDLKTNEEACELIASAVEKAGYDLGREIQIALDPATSELANEAEKLHGGSKSNSKSKAKGVRYCYFKSDPKKLVSSDDMIALWERWRAKWPIRSIEDGLAEHDWAGWKTLTERLGATTQLVGDDLFCTNATILTEGIAKGCANAVLVKVNQIGTLTETIETVSLAHRSGYRTVMSHRSGETEDATIADLAVALNCGQIKTGAPCRSDRNAKYNQLLRIAEELGSGAQFGV
ncbi:MAG: phosphopyruvate hydratase [Phycisphaerales bacterium]